MEGLKEWLKGKRGGGGIALLLGKYRYVLLIVLIGAILLALPGGETDREQPEPASAAGEDFSLVQLEEKMEAALGRMEGVGKVDLVLTLQSGTERQLAEDRERDYRAEEDHTISEEKVQNSAVILSRGSGQQEVVVTGSVYPRFRGALVVCSGGGDPAVRLRVSQAVSALTGLGLDKISVNQMEE